MKLSVSAYRAHSSAHKKILSSSYQSQLNYGSTAAASSSSSAHPPTTLLMMEPIDGQSSSVLCSSRNNDGVISGIGGGASHLKMTEHILSPTSTSMSNSEHNPREGEEDSSNPPSSDCKSPSQKAKPTQRWMKLRTTVQLSSAIQKKPPLKREDSFLKRFSTRQIPEAQETVEDTGSEGPHHDLDKIAASKKRKRYLQRKRTVVNPDENFYFYWLMLLTFCILYNLWTLIVRQSFPELQEILSKFWLVCDCISDIAFILDIAVQLRTGYLEQGLVVYDTRKLALHYMSSKQFLFDLAALLPLDLLQLRYGSQPLLRFPRFFKVYRSVKFYYIVESRTVWPNLWRVINLIHILLILAHWFGCFYYLLSEAEGFQGDWVYPYRPGDYATLTRKYLGSLYWSTLTLTTIGDLPTPETNVEASNSADGPLALPRRGIKTRLLRHSSSNGYVFTIVSYLIGVFIFATIVGQVGNVITNRNANRLEFERLLDGAKTYMRHHKVPGGMKRRVLRWYDYSWSRGRIQGGGDINTALGLLPDKLKTELALHVNLSVLKKVTIFQECQPEFLHDLVLKMKAYIFTPGDSICRKGEVAREMFIIADGILEVLSETGKVLTTMKAGDFFGEIGILNLDGLNKRTADVRSVGYSELFSLSREDVLAAMKDYPEAQEILQTLGRKRLMEVRGVNKRRSRPSSSNEGDIHHTHHHGHQQQSTQIDNRNQISASSTSTKIVEKIKSDVKGIKSVLRKSKTERLGDEPYETHHINNSSSNSSVASKKSVLKRMNHVKSRDLGNISDEKSDVKATTAAATTTTTTTTSTSGPIGAGLPLLQRLRLLKEKQDREEREAKLSTIKSPTHTHTHITSAVSPQESIKEETEPEVEDSPLTSTILTSSQPQLQNFYGTSLKNLILDDTQQNKISTPTPPTSVKCELLSYSPSSLSPPTTNIISTVLRKNSVPVSGPPKIPLKVSFRDRILELQNKSSSPTSSIQFQQQQHQPIKQATAAASSTTITSNIILPYSTGIIDTTDRTKRDHIPSSSVSNNKLSSSSIFSSEFQESLIPTISTKALEPSLVSLIFKQQQLKEQHHHHFHPTQQQQQHQLAATLKQVQIGDRTKLWKKLKLATLISSKSYPNLLTTSNNIKKIDSQLLIKPSSTTNIHYSSGESIITTDKSHIPISSKQQFEQVNSQKSKTYRSIDDLSPEYNGLPFVKKLKILNERQKIEELESIIQSRSRSLDCTNLPKDTSSSMEIFQQPQLFRSQSDASTIYASSVKRAALAASNIKTTDGGNIDISSIQSPSSPLQVPQCLYSPLSPESNETLERRQLKSILRKISREKALATSASTTTTATDSSLALIPENQKSSAIPTAIIPSTVDMKSLLSAPTIEGYIARHSTKLMKSVTVNTTLPSPPISANNLRRYESTSGNFFSFSPTEVITTTTPLPKLPPDRNGSKKEVEQSILLKQSFPTIIRDKSTTNDPKLNMQVSLTGQEYLNEITLAIKNVIHVHMTEIQTKLQSRIATLELEVNRRDETIEKLQKRIEILEKESKETCMKCGNWKLMQHQASEHTGGSSTELLFMREDSVDTIFAVPSSSPITSTPVQARRRNKLRNNKRSQSISSQPQHQRSHRIKSCSELTVPEDYTEMENLRRPRSYQEVLISDITGNIANLDSDSVILDIEQASSTSSSTSIISNLQELPTEDEDDENRSYDSNEHDDEDDGNSDDNDDDIEKSSRQSSSKCNDWEVRMLAAELDRRESNNRRQRAASESFVHQATGPGVTYYLRQRHHHHHQHNRQQQRQQQKQKAKEKQQQRFLEQKEQQLQQPVEEEDDEEDDEYVALRPRAASLDQFNSKLKRCDSVSKAVSLDRNKDRL